MDISKLKVNGELFNINVLTVSPEEPTQSDRTALWVKPNMITDGYGPSQYYDQSLGNSYYAVYDQENGLNWMTQSTSGFYSQDRCVLQQIGGGGMYGSDSRNNYAPFSVVPNTEYLIKLTSNSSVQDTWLYKIIYLDEAQRYIKEESEYFISGVTSYEVHANIPENCRHILIAVNTQGNSNSPNLNVEICKGGYTYKDAGLYYLENDVYTKIY